MNEKILLFIILIILSISLMIGVYYLEIAIIDYCRKRKFLKKYDIPKTNCKIRVKNRKSGGDNYYIIKYPRWKKHKKDGTADLRVKSNSIIWKKSELYFEKYKIISKRPYDIVYIVKELRSKGESIELCKEEKQKRERLLKNHQIFSESQNLNGIVDYYSSEPTRFEYMCAKLFECMGYHASVTPATNDGGYDIFLENEEETGIVECKCYMEGNNIGRPALQKLVGANSIQRADKMFFITTSEFSSVAKEYARSTGIVLIDGRRLLDLMAENGLFSQQEKELEDGEYQLEISDMKEYVPADIYKKYFKGLTR
ncbi:MAG: restriction endonuclease [Eisenbergiella sp.]